MPEDERFVSGKKTISERESIALRPEAFHRYGGARSRS